MKRFWIKARFIIIFFLALSSLTAFSYIRLGHESVEKNQSLSSLLEQKAKAVSLQSRGPASQRSQKQGAVGSDSLFIQHELFCTSTGRQISHSKVSRNMVMLNFKLCKNLQNVEQVKIENESNGFKAQSFKMATHSFKTDYIQLSPGRNKLKLEIILKDGQKIAEALDILSGS